MNRFKLLALSAWLIFTVCFASTLEAQQKTTGFLNKVYQGKHKYTVFVPEGYSTRKEWPVILYLHSAGERGTDGNSPAFFGIGPAIRARAKSFPFIVVFPQAENYKGRILTRWSEEEEGTRALEILAEVEKTYRVDKTKRFLTGWSMGGYGAWSLAAAHPEMWSAVVPIAGGGDPAWAEKLKGVRIWAFHGGRDTAVRSTESRTMIEAVQAAGGTPLFTEFANTDHSGIWQKAYHTEALYSWLLNPATKVDPATALNNTPAIPGDALRNPIPFKPALHVPQAVAVRIGNDALKDVSDSVPKLVKPDLLRGGIADMYSGTEVQGVDFSVQFSGIGYNSKLQRVHIEAFDKDRAVIHVALENINLYVSRTYVSGSGGRSATAGPISVMIGHRRPVWLSAVVRPYIEEGRIRFQLISSSFSIPQDNWYVSGPAGVGVRGWGMTQERVSNGIVDGIYGSKYRIEAEVRGVVPGMLKEFEKQLDISKYDHLASGFWILPAYQPQFRLWPQQITTDKTGITLVLGLSASGPTPETTPDKPAVSEKVGLEASQIAAVKQLQFGLSPGMLEPLSKLVVDADLGRLHMLDTPNPELRSFSDKEFLSRIVPGIVDQGEVSTELVLSKPVRVVHEPATESTQARFALEFPEIKVIVNTRMQSSEEWKPYVTFLTSVTQALSPTMSKPTSLTRRMQINWEGDPAIAATAAFADGSVEGIDVERYKSDFATAWKAFIQSGSAVGFDVPDLDLGFSKLRMSNVSWDSPYMTGTFERAGVRLTNSSSVDLVYETKNPYSLIWSKPFTLKAGESASFNIGYPLLYRQQTPQGYKLFTLPAGSHSEYRSPAAGGPPSLFQAKEILETPK